MTGVDYRWITGAGPGYQSGTRGLILGTHVPATGEQLRIRCSGGGGGGFGDEFGTRLQFTYWLALPADAARVTVTAAWPDLTTETGAVDLPLNEIRAAARRVVDVR